MQIPNLFKYLFYALAVFLSVACNSLQATKYYSYKEEKFYDNNVPGRPVAQTVMINLPDWKVNGSGIYVFDTVIAVIDYHSDTCVHLFGVGDGNKIAGIGRKGSGNNDLQSCLSLSYDHRLKTFWAFDVAADKMLPLPWPGTTAPTGTDAVHFRKTLFCSFPKWLNDSIIISPHVGYKRSRVLFMDRAGKVVMESDSLYATPDDDKVPQKIVSMSFDSELAVAPNGSKFVLAGRFCDKLELFDGQGKLKKVISGPEHFEPVFSVREEHGAKRARVIKDKTKYGYINVRVTNDKIYALYSGKFVDAARRSNSSDNIYIFNWKGEAEGRLTLDHDILSFDINSGSDTIYTLSPDGKVSYVRI